MKWPIVVQYHDWFPTITKGGLYVAILLCMVGSFAGGWAFGTWSSPRTNSVAVQYYAEALDLDTQAKNKEALARQSAACVSQMTAIEHEMVKNTQACTEARELDGERILGLETALRAHGVRTVRAQ